MWCPYTPPLTRAVRLTGPPRLARQDQTIVCPFVETGFWEGMLPDADKCYTYAGKVRAVTCAVTCGSCGAR